MWMPAFSAMGSLHGTGHHNIGFTVVVYLSTLAPLLVARHGIPPVPMGNDCHCLAWLPDLHRHVQPCCRGCAISSSVVGHTKFSLGLTFVVSLMSSRPFLTSWAPVNPWQGWSHQHMAAAQCSERMLVGSAHNAPGYLNEYVRPVTKIRQTTRSRRHCHCRIIAASKSMCR
jgi:hypothetical protein